MEELCYEPEDELLLHSPPQSPHLHQQSGQHLMSTCGFAPTTHCPKKKGGGG